MDAVAVQRVLHPVTVTPSAAATVIPVEQRVDGVAHRTPIFRLCCRFSRLLSAPKCSRHIGPCGRQWQVTATAPRSPERLSPAALARARWIPALQPGARQPISPGRRRPASRTCQGGVVVRVPCIKDTVIATGHNWFGVRQPGGRSCAGCPALGETPGAACSRPGPGRASRSPPGAARSAACGCRSSAWRSARPESSQDPPPGSPGRTAVSSGCRTAGTGACGRLSSSKMYISLPVPGSYTIS
jgi:hypothetical protein